MHFNFLVYGNKKEEWRKPNFKFDECKIVCKSEQKKKNLPFPDINFGVVRIHRQGQFYYLSSIRMCSKESVQKFSGGWMHVLNVASTFAIYAENYSEYITFFLIFSTLIIAAYIY